MKESVYQMVRGVSLHGIMLLSFLVAAWPPIADAKPILYTRWISIGSSGDPGGVTYIPIVEGWGDDGTVGLPDGSRFPSGGKGGRGRVAVDKKGRFTNPGNPSLNCTIPPLQPKAEIRSWSVKDNSDGDRKWTVYLGRSDLSGITKASYRAAMNEINNALVAVEGGGVHFSLVETGEVEKGRIFVMPRRKGADDIPVPGNTISYISRSGFISSSLIAARSVMWSDSDPLPPDEEQAQFADALRQLNQALGVGTLPVQDLAYPSAMAPGYAGEHLDPCTTAMLHMLINLN